jgi:hypothetical protein
MTEEEKMLAGKLYDPSDPKLETRRLLAHRLSMEYNNTLPKNAKPFWHSCCPIAERTHFCKVRCNLTMAAIPASANAATQTSTWSFWTCVR